MKSRLVAFALLVTGVVTAQGTTPKASERDYPVHASLDGLSIGAEYLVHSFSGGRETFVARDYLVVEVAIFPVKGANLLVDASQFTLRINDKKQLINAQMPEFVAASLTERWDDNHSRAAVGVGPVIFGAPSPAPRFPGDPTAPPSRVPPRPDANPTGTDSEPPVTAEQLVAQTAFPGGEHHKPVSGYLYFPYSRKVKTIRKMELSFNGPAGNVMLPLL